MKKHELEARLKNIIANNNDSLDIMKLNFERQIRLMASLVPVEESTPEERQAATVSRISPEPPEAA